LEYYGVKNKNPKHCIYNAWDEFQNEKIRGTTQIRENLSLCIQTYATLMITEAHPVEAYLRILCSVRPRKSIRVFLLAAITPSATLCEEEYNGTILSRRFKYGLIIREKTSFCQDVFLKKKFFVTMIQFRFFFFVHLHKEKTVFLYKKRRDLFFIFDEYV
jgi:hypothetical protein